MRMHLTDFNPNESGKISDELFQKTFEKAKHDYEMTPEVFCPYLKQKVHLNKKGFEHIRMKEWNRARSKSDQYLRLKLLKLAPEILTKSHTVQGVWKSHDWERVKSHGEWIKIMKNVTYYEFVAVIGKVRIKIIVKEIEGGVKFFWTIIPFWKMNTVSNTRIIHEGDPERD